MGVVSFQVQQLGSIKAVIPPIWVGRGGLSRDNRWRVQSLAVLVEVYQAFDVPIHFKGSTWRITQGVVDICERFERHVRAQWLIRLAETCVMSSSTRRIEDASWTA